MRVCCRGVPALEGCWAAHRGDRAWVAPGNGWCWRWTVGCRHAGQFAMLCTPCTGSLPMQAREPQPPHPTRSLPPLPPPAAPAPLRSEPSRPATTGGWSSCSRPAPPTWQGGGCGRWTLLSTSPSPAPPRCATPGGFRRHAGEGCGQACCRLAVGWRSSLPTPTAVLAFLAPHPCPKATAPPPPAAQHELDLADAQLLVQHGCKFVFEGELGLCLSCSLCS